MYLLFTLERISGHTNTYKPPANCGLYLSLLTALLTILQGSGVLSKFSRSQIPLSLLESMTNSFFVGHVYLKAASSVRSTLMAPTKTCSFHTHTCPVVSLLFYFFTALTAIFLSAYLWAPYQFLLTGIWVFKTRRYPVFPLPQSWSQFYKSLVS